MTSPSDTAMPAWVRWLTAYNRAWFTAITTRLDQLEKAPPVRPTVLRSVKDAATHCGFEKTEHFLTWARRVGLDIPSRKLTKQQRLSFLIKELDAAILRDPSLCNNRRHRPKN